MSCGGMWLDIMEGPERPADSPSGDGGTQLWRGGEVDRSTRAARPGSVRTLVLRDLPEPAVRDTGQVTGKTLLSWDLAPVLSATETSPSHAGGLVIVSMDIDPAVEEEFNDWYNTEHVPMLRKVEGVIAARRFRAERGRPGYVAVYHLDDARRYASPAWLAANETPWMKRMRRFQTNRTYLIFNERM